MAPRFVCALLCLAAALAGCNGDPPAQPYDEAEQTKQTEPDHLVAFLPNAAEASVSFDRAVRRLTVEFLDRPAPKKVSLQLKLKDRTATILLAGEDRIFSAEGNVIPDEIKTIEDVSGTIVARWGEVPVPAKISHDHGSQAGHQQGGHSHSTTAPENTWVTPLVVGYCVVIVIASLLGGFLPSWIRLTHRRMQFLVSAIGGLMLGIAVFHLLPHAIVELSARGEHGPHNGRLMQLGTTAFHLEIVPRPESALFYLHRKVDGHLRPERSWSLSAETPDGASAEVSQAVPRVEAGRLSHAVLLTDSETAMPGARLTIEHVRGEAHLTVPPALANPLNLSASWLAAGLLGMFFLLRAFHFHHHGEVVTPEGRAADVQYEHDHHHDHDHDHDHDAGHEDHHHHHELPAGKLSWLGVFLGLALHTLIDGMALAAAVSAEAAHYTGFALAGLGIFLAVVLHKPLDAVSITSLMAAGGWSQRARTFANIGFSMMCPLGAVIFLLGVREFSEFQHLIVGCALACAAGVFLCISLADLLPELEFHSHDRIWLSVLLLLGIVVAILIGFLEPEHAHGHSH